MNKERIPQYWPDIDFMEHIILILTVPAEYSENDKAIMRECAFNAGLISVKNSEKLQFTTERMFNFFQFDYTNTLLWWYINKVFLKWI